MEEANKKEKEKEVAETQEGETKKELREVAVATEKGEVQNKTKVDVGTQTEESAAGKGANDAVTEVGRRVEAADKAAQTNKVAEGESEAGEEADEGVKEASETKGGSEELATKGIQDGNKGVQKKGKGNGDKENKDKDVTGARGVNAQR